MNALIKNYINIELDSNPENLDMEFNAIMKQLNNESKKIKLLKFLINQKLIDDEFYDNILKLYEIGFNNGDLLPICSSILKGAAKTRTLDTSIPYYIHQAEGHNRSFDHWYEEYNATALVAYVNEDDIDLKKQYTTKELTRIIKLQKIVLLNLIPTGKPRIVDSIPSNPSIKKLTTMLEYPYLSNLKEDYPEYYPIIVDFIKAYFTKEKLMRDLYQLLKADEEKILNLKNKALKKQKYYNSIEKSYKAIEIAFEKFLCSSNCEEGFVKVRTRE